MHSKNLLRMSLDGGYGYIITMASIRFDESCNLIGQFEVRIFAEMLSAVVAGHYEIFNALQNKP